MEVLDALKDDIGQGKQILGTYLQNAVFQI